MLEEAIRYGVRSTPYYLQAKILSITVRLKEQYKSQGRVQE
jgi:hypothetical protein